MAGRIAEVFPESPVKTGVVQKTALDCYILQLVVCLLDEEVRTLEPCVIIELVDARTEELTETVLDPELVRLKMSRDFVYTGQGFGKVIKDIVMYLLDECCILDLLIVCSFRLNCHDWILYMR